VEDLLRSLIVHRLRAGEKAVMRVPLSQDVRGPQAPSILCEPCNRWVRIDGDGDFYDCEDCGRSYRMEFAVFTVVEGD
jgi:hypothetical protein